MRERAHAAALGVPRVREVHNVSVVRSRRRHRAVAPPQAAGRALARRGARDRRGGRARDPRGGAGGRLRCRRTSSRWRRRRSGTPPGGRTSRTTATSSRGSCARRRGAEPRELRFLHTDDGPRRVPDASPRRRDGARRRARAARAGSRSAIRRERPEIADVIVHTEPCMKLCMFTPRETRPRARLAGADRRRPRHPARRADAAGVLHRRRRRARARCVSARGRRLPRARSAPAVGSHLRRRRLSLREPGRDRRARRRRSAVARGRR